jgi:hypothetical protein
MNFLQRRMFNYSVGYCNLMIECGLREETESKKDPSVNAHKLDWTALMRNTILMNPVTLLPSSATIPE